MEKLRRVLDIYITDNQDFIIADSKKRIRNKYSLEYEKKQLKYDEIKKEIKIMDMQDRKNSSHKISIKNICQITENEYLQLLSQRKEEVLSGWTERRKILEIMNPYINVGICIPEHIIKERDEKISSIPKPASLLELISKKSSSNNEISYFFLSLITALIFLLS
ncbi:MAG: hypothetical protein AABW65_01535 [Nanoarchaeota archaeon]